MKRLLVIFSFVFTVFNSLAQDTYIIQEATFELKLKLKSKSGYIGNEVVFNSDKRIYYTAFAGNASWPCETFDEKGNYLAESEVGFDMRGLWYNPNLQTFEGNGYNDVGVKQLVLDANGFPTGHVNTVFTGFNQPDPQSVGDYDFDSNEIIFYHEGKIYRYKREDNSFIGSYDLLDLPPIGNINTTTVIYVGQIGAEIGILDFAKKEVLFFEKNTGKYAGKSKLPGDVITNDKFRFALANNCAWFYDVDERIWYGYKVFLKENKRKPEPPKGTYIKVNVFDAETKQPVQAKIILQLLSDGTRQDSALEVSNVSFSKVKTGNQYLIYANAAGYLEGSQSITVSDENSVSVEIPLTAIKEGVTVRLNNISFEKGKADLLAESYPELDRVAEFLKNNPNIVIEISGHTDNTGDPNLSLKLSKERAENVKHYLVAKGIKGHRLSAKGYGITKPIADNRTEEGRKQNRRVEFSILKK